MLKINILSKSVKNIFTKYSGYWNFFFRYKNELNELGYDFNFYNKLNNKFLNADYLVLNSRFFSEKNNERLNQVENIYKTNKNLIWWDMRDSAGTNQFNIMPYVKYYVKKQIYKDKNLYFKSFYQDRIYTDYYVKNYNLKIDPNYNYNTILNKKDLDKIILGWNIGVQKFFDYSKYSNFQIYLSKINFLNPEKYLMLFNDPNLNGKNNITCEFGQRVYDNFYDDIILFQRKLLVENLIKKKYSAKFIKDKNQKVFYNKLKKSILSIGTFGSGEICQRDFEATYLGSSFTTSNMDHLQTWPNIYIPEQTYLPLNWNFSNLDTVIERILGNNELYHSLVLNAQKIIKESFEEKGKNYFLNLLKKIF